MPDRTPLSAVCFTLFWVWRLSLGKSICYGELGCFDNSPPFDNAVGQLPASPAQVGTSFLLFTRKTKSSSGEQLSYTGVNTISGTTFNPKLPVKIIVHGFSNGIEPWIKPMKDAFLSKLDCNIIIAYWLKGAAVPDYFSAAANTRIVGSQMALLIRRLLNAGSSFDKVHIIGLSLGAHVAGYAGSALAGKVSRISGLDPAGPLFDGKNARVRLDPTDARFVDVIHTNGAPLIQGGFGITIPVGHVDFYPNGGKSQPGCLPLWLAIITGGSIAEIAAKSACHHVRSAYLYTDSLITASCKFTAYKCGGGYADFSAGKCSNCKTTECSEMGYNADIYPARGLMYLATKDSSPFCAK